MAGSGSFLRLCLSFVAISESYTPGSSFLPNQRLHYKTLWNSRILLPYTPPLFRSNCSTLKVYIPPFVPFQLFHHQSLHSSTVFANMVVAPRLEIGCNPDTITMDRTFLNILKQVPASVTLVVILKVGVRIVVHEIRPP